MSCVVCLVVWIIMLCRCVPVPGRGRVVHRGGAARKPHKQRGGSVDGQHSGMSSSVLARGLGRVGLGLLEVLLARNDAMCRAWGTHRSTTPRLTFPSFSMNATTATTDPTAPGLGESRATTPPAGLLGEGSQGSGSGTECEVGSALSAGWIQSGSATIRAYARTRAGLCMGGGLGC